MPQYTHLSVATIVAGAKSVWSIPVSDCAVSLGARRDCGYPGVDQNKCEAAGCCWDAVNPNPQNIPWCFHQGGHVPGPSPSPSPDAPRGKSSVFVHLFEWSWQDVALECEQWLGPKGFQAVQVSPPVEHVQGPQWWTRYQPVTYKLVSRSGDEDAFVDMVTRCKAVGVDIYADAVFNHIAGGSGTGVNGSPYGNRATPIYTQEDMHHTPGDPNSNCAVSNYQDQHNVQYCDLEGLPDLCTSCPRVQKTVAAYLNRLHSLGVAGFRIDAAKHQDATELEQLLQQVDSGMYRFQEVISGAGEAVKPEMYFKTGQVSEFQYPRTLGPNFVDDGKLKYLNSFGEGWGLMPSTHAVVFLDNHDTQRGEAVLTYKNGALYRLANIFMLAHPYGYPKVMSSYYFTDRDAGPPAIPIHAGDGAPLGCDVEPLDSPPTQHPALNMSFGNNFRSDARPWVCEHRWIAVANMVAWRTSAGDNGVTNFQAPGGDTISFCRGPAACVALNRQPSAIWAATLTFAVPPGLYCDVAQSDDTKLCPTVEVRPGGSVTLQVPPLGAVAVHIGKRVNATAFATLDMTPISI